MNESRLEVFSSATETNASIERFIAANRAVLQRAGLGTMGNERDLKRILKNNIPEERPAVAAGGRVFVDLTPGFEIDWLNETISGYAFVLTAAAANAIHLQAFPLPPPGYAALLCFHAGADAGRRLKDEDADRALQSGVDVLGTRQCWQTQAERCRTSYKRNECVTDPQTYVLSLLRTDMLPEMLFLYVRFAAPALLDRDNQISRITTGATMAEMASIADAACQSVCMALNRDNPLLLWETSFNMPLAIPRSESCIPVGCCYMLRHPLVVIRNPNTGDVRINAADPLVDDALSSQHGSEQMDSLEETLRRLPPLAGLVPLSNARLCEMTPPRSERHYVRNTVATDASDVYGDDSSGGNEAQSDCTIPAVSFHLMPSYRTHYRTAALVSRRDAPASMFLSPLCTLEASAVINPATVHLPTLANLVDRVGGESLSVSARSALLAGVYAHIYRMSNTAEAVVIEERSGRVTQTIPIALLRDRGAGPGVGDDDDDDDDDEDAEFGIRD
jgi:hypothetical protein